MSRILISTLKAMKKTSSEWIDDDIHRLGAALSFYALFSIPPLFIIVLAMAGFLYGDEAARRELFGQLSIAVGSEGSSAIQSLVSSAHAAKGGKWTAAVALATLLISATGAFVELQSSLNTIWGVRRKPGRGIQNALKDRLILFAMIVSLALLLLVGLIFTEALTAAGQLMGGIMPNMETLWRVINFVVSYGVLTLLVAVMFKTLPDVRLAWKNVWIGAIITALLFNLGKLLFGLYLMRIDVTSAYGAASSLVIALLWIYYSAQILLFGAKFTQVYSDMNHGHVRPIPGAEAVTVETIVSKNRPAS